MPHRGFAVSVLWIAALSVTGPVPLAAGDDDPQRTRDGLLVLYDFSDDDDRVIRDRSGHAEPIDLRIEDVGAVRRERGALHIERDTLIRSDQPARRIIDAVRTSGQITVETWVRPDNTQQEGPARIVPLSADTTHRNFTLGQEGDRYDFRLRSAKTSDNAMPSLAGPRRGVKTELTHVVYTRQTNGRTRLHVNGRVVADGRAEGSLNGWNDGFQLALANELTRDRPWRGTMHLVAIYDRALSDEEVSRHFALKSSASACPPRCRPRATTACSNRWPR